MAAGAGMLRAGPLGRYRRAILIEAAPGRATAAMEDDVHHLALSLDHAEGRIVTMAGDAPRTPWAVCPGAVGALDALVGLRLEDVGRMAPADRFEQCMHLHDLATLAAAHAGTPGFRRLYRIEADHDASPPALRLWRDGAEMLAWRAAGGRIVGSCFDGVALARLADHLGGLTTDDREAALVLRRATLIAAVRRLDLDTVPDSTATNPDAPANCYAKQAGRRAAAVRRIGTTRDFWGEQRWPLVP